MSWTLPPSFQHVYERLDSIAAVALRRGEYGDAAELYRLAYDMILERQQHDARRYHKAVPAHMIGICRLFQGEQFEAFTYVLRAYFEDCLSQTEPETIRILPAANVLREGFMFDQPVMEATIRVAETLRQTPPLDPDQGVNQVFESRGIRGFEGAFALCTRPDLVVVQRLRKLDEPGGDPHRRVFVGGAYSNIVLLKRLESVLIELGYDAIAAYNFEMGDMDPYDKSMYLLGRCTKAIFEISESDGFQLEIERAKETGKDPILVFQVEDAQRRPSRISSMLLNSGLRTYGYRTFDDLRSALSTLLRQASA
jgi:hypothetical protein